MCINSPPQQNWLPHTESIWSLPCPWLGMNTQRVRCSYLSDVQALNKPVLSWLSNSVTISLYLGHGRISSPRRTEHFYLRPLNIVGFAMLNASGHSGERCWVMLNNAKFLFGNVGSCWIRLTSYWLQVSFRKEVQLSKFLTGRNEICGATYLLSRKEIRGRKSNGCSRGMNIEQKIGMRPP